MSINLGRFRITPEVLADLVGVPPGCEIIDARGAPGGEIEFIVSGSGVPPSKGPDPLPIQLMVTEERGHGHFGGTIRRTRFQPVKETLLG